MLNVSGEDIGFKMAHIYEAKPIKENAREGRNTSYRNINILLYNNINTFCHCFLKKLTFSLRFDIIQPVHVYMI